MKPPAAGPLEAAMRDGGARDSRGLPDDAVAVGTVGRPHGVRGEMRVVPESGDPTRLLRLAKLWIVDRDGLARRHVVRSVRLHGDVALLTVDGVADRDVAAAMTHSRVHARQADLPPWGPNQFGVDDVVGITMLDEVGAVGRIRDVVTVSAQDCFEVELAPERGGGIALVPAVRDWLVELDVAGGRLVMRLPAGLLDEEGLR